MTYIGKNVERVLTQIDALDSWPALETLTRELDTRINEFSHAERITLSRAMAERTTALGATLPPYQQRGNT